MQPMPLRTPVVFAVLLLAAIPARADPPAPTLLEAFTLIASRPKIDLTHAFSPETPVASAFGQAKMTPAVDPRTLEAYTIAKDGFRATYYAMVGQYGTHVDPPAHIAATGATMDQISLDAMILPLTVLDDTPFLAADPAHAFTRDDVLAWEKVHGPVQKGSFAALRTDMAKDWTKDPVRFKRTPFPGWSLSALKMLIEERGVVAIGHESLETDATGTRESETYLSASGHYQVGVLDNLDKVPATGAFVVVSWPKVKNGLGFPARAYAVLP